MFAVAEMIQEPMAFQPIRVGLKKDEPQFLAKVNDALLALVKSAFASAIVGRLKHARQLTLQVRHASRPIIHLALSAAHEV